MFFSKSFPTFRQFDEMDCGPTCIRIISKYYGREYSMTYLKALSYTNRTGSTLLGLSEAAETIGFQTNGACADYAALQQDVQLPCIAHWNQNHFVVVYKVTNDKVYLSDPGYGRIKYSKEDFIKSWATNGEGIILELLPTQEFFTAAPAEEAAKPARKTKTYFLNYVSSYKKYLLQIILGLVIGSCIELIFPFLTQSIVDVGIKKKDLTFIYLILLTQLFYFLGGTSIGVIRSWILVHISSRLNFNLVSDFFIKLMKLPISFFDVRVTGDIMQRMNDHNRIEQFLTTTSLSTLFSIINIFIFNVVLFIYNKWIFVIYLVFTTIYIAWILLFYKKRAEIDYRKFLGLSDNQSKVIELINGMQEIKLHNAETQKRRKWEEIQERLFSVNLKSLRVEQLLSSGSTVINEIKNILITVFVASLVVEGTITIGVMLSISYILGHLNSPIQQLVTFAQNYQDARLSILRLNEIHNQHDEDEDERQVELGDDNLDSLHLNNVSFHYNGPNSAKVLNCLNLTIPRNKVTAIVGSSGSGKTTLMKLLLNFYNPTSGQICLGELPLHHITHQSWRERCGTVMQEGYIFSDTIERNIAVGGDLIDARRLNRAIDIANIRDFVEAMPLQLRTKIGQEGVGLSTGQKQRILIARAVYKDPDFIFFDEATNSLDANNETVIMEKLNSFFDGRTVVVIAHRLSTVRNADQIVVLEKGDIVEVGSHYELLANRGLYFDLVKNQLEVDA